MPPVASGVVEVCVSYIFLSFSDYSSIRRALQKAISSVFQIRKRKTPKIQRGKVTEPGGKWQSDFNVGKLLLLPLSIVGWAILPILRL